MAIKISKYVDIVSGVGGANNVRQRDLVGRIFTSNVRVPVDSIVEATSAADVAAYFGASSEEYARALFYFSWISKNITRPQKIQYSRYAKDAAEPRIFGSRVTATLDELRQILTGTLTMTVGGETATFNAIDLQGAASFSDIAGLLQQNIRTASGGQYPSSTVVYDAIAGAFNFTGSVPEPASISVTNDTGTNDISRMIGWDNRAIYSPGVAATGVVDVLNDTVDRSTNFGSFLFMDALSSSQIVDVANWNDERNVEFMYCIRCDDSNRAALAAALVGISGTALTYAPTAGEFDEMCPMLVMAATDYTRRESTQNYMFQAFDGLTAKVVDTPLSDELDALRINYYGQTQTAGQNISFYQRGIMGGGQQDPTDQNTYANEMWLKDAARANIMTLFLTVGRVSADASGRGQIIAVLQDAIDRALRNGTIAVDKPLTQSQKAYITSVTGDPLAWYQVQGVGYWVDAAMESTTATDGRTEWLCKYLIIYAKDDAIRAVNGTHTLI